ncbi:MAG TPA: NADH-quinone oxidoreductase subunit L [Caldithrix abyssi]|uniref:NADH-quinone oxidoreductase subunit L n=1 Tax=Caldithrix abyssi TaxID=187145 RepID=A0A7V5PPL3_CALAY|nr:NADH-quinone oxidoreductase subunit L [Caldithrix abyssi]
MIQTALYIWLLPLAAFVINILIGKRLPRKGDWVSVSAIGISFVLSLILLFKMLANGDPNFMLHASVHWIDLGSFKIDMGIYLDNLAIIMVAAVSTVSFLVHVYSIGYMHGDPLYNRFFAYLSLFSFSMLGLVLWDNLFGIYMMWELVGICSYLLIGFYFTKDSAANAGKKAFITNRVGDYGFLIGLLIVFASLGTFNLLQIHQGISQGLLSGGWLTAAGVLLFAGAVGKSAQFPLHVWLPDAMEGPTPVSALIHAATMVAAGVYLMARLSFMLSFDAMLVVAYVGGFTAIFAATIAITQNDIKRVLAYSTISQLGYMIMAMGVGSYVAGFFHLVTHAMFKAGLFLGSGSVIHAMHHAMEKEGIHDDPNDIRLMGGFKNKMPVTYWTFLIFSLALSGIPFFSGFLSKDAILGGTLAFAMSQSNPIHYLLPTFGFVAALITAFYMFRLIIKTFYGKPQKEELYRHIHESPKVMTVPLMVLAFLSIYFIYTLPSLNFINAEGGWFHHLIEKPISAVATQLGHAVYVITEHAEHAAHVYGIMISIVFALSGILLAFYLYFWKKVDVARLTEKIKPLYLLSFNKYYFDEIYNATLVKGLLLWNQMLAWFDLHIIDGIVNGSAWVMRNFSALDGLFDKYFIDGLVNAVADVIQDFGQSVRRIQTGQIQNYILGAVLGTVLIIIVTMI